MDQDVAGRAAADFFARQAEAIERDDPETIAFVAADRTITYAVLAEAEARRGPAYAESISARLKT